MTIQAVLLVAWTEKLLNSYVNASQMHKKLFKQVMSVKPFEWTETARENANELARDLELSALMFPNRQSGVDLSQQARDTSTRIRDLELALEEAIPQLREFVEQHHREQLERDAPRQGAAAHAAKRLIEQFEASPDGAPSFASRSRSNKSRLRSNVTWCASTSPRTTTPSCTLARASSARAS